MNDSLCECHLPPFCDCCQREVDYVRGSKWHGRSRLCRECFYQWYDGDSGVDRTDPVSIGNHVRKKHGLAPLHEAEMVDHPVAQELPRGEAGMMPTEAEIQAAAAVLTLDYINDLDFGHISPEQAAKDILEAAEKARLETRSE